MAVSHVNAFKPDAHSFSSSSFDNHVTQSQRCGGGFRAEGTEGIGPETADMNGLVTQLKEVVAQLKDIIAHLKGGASPSNNGEQSTPTETQENQQPESPRQGVPAQKSEGSCGANPSEGTQQLQSIIELLKQIIAQLGGGEAGAQSKGASAGNGDAAEGAGGESLPELTNELDSLINDMPGREGTHKTAGESGGVMEELKSVVEELKQLVQALKGGKGGGANNPQEAAPVQEIQPAHQEPVTEQQPTQTSGSEDPAVQEWLDFKADRQQRLEQTDDPALKKHYQAEIEVANATLSQMGVNPEVDASRSEPLSGEYAHLVQARASAQ